MPNFTGKSGGGPHHMKKYGQGKSPIMNLGFIKSERSSTSNGIPAVAPIPLFFINGDVPGYENPFILNGPFFISCCNKFISNAG